MQTCPFHEHSTVQHQGGDLNLVRCEHCGEYRISDVALAQVAALKQEPEGWSTLVSKRQVISSRDTRELSVA